MVVRAPAIEAQLIETFTLLTINHQSLIATKANRIQRAARGRTVLEFGSQAARRGRTPPSWAPRRGLYRRRSRYGLHTFGRGVQRARRRYYGPMPGSR